MSKIFFSTHEVKPGQSNPDLRKERNYIGLEHTQWVSRYTHGDRRNDFHEMVAEQLKDLKSQLRETDDLTKLIEKKIEIYRHYQAFLKLPDITDLIASEFKQGAYKKIVLFAKHADLMKYIAISLHQFRPKTIFVKSNPVSVERNLKSFNNPHGKCRIIICNIQAANLLDVKFDDTAFCIFLETELDFEKNLGAIQTLSADKVYARSFILENDTTDARIENNLAKTLLRELKPKGPSESIVFPLAQN